MIKVGKKSEEAVFKLYTGVGVVNVLAVNPNKAKAEAILGRELKDEPVYTGTLDDGKKYVRVTFYVKTDEEAKINNKINLISTINFMITEAPVVGSNSGKVKVIDKYDRTAWVTKEEFDKKAIPVYSNGPAKISSDYRPLYQGEENLIEFLTAWLNLPPTEEYDNSIGKFKEVSNLEACGTGLDITKIIKGDISDIAEVIPTVSNYGVKCAIGVRTTNEGRQYQEIYNRMFLKNSSSNYEKLDADIQNVKNNGGLSSSEFSTKPLHEYVVEATDFSTETKETEETSNPWDNMFS